MGIESGLEIANRRMQEKKLERATRIICILALAGVLFELFEQAGMPIDKETKRKAVFEAIRQSDKRNYNRS